jgi:NAD(P)-dependent dehydrogenase (short-subunit alcohol dehydrogenase family)
MWTLITGGGKRLGATLAIHLAEQGHSIVVHYRTSEKEAQQVVKICESKGVRAIALQGNFSTLEGVQTFINAFKEQIGSLSCLIHNVGNYFISSALETPIHEWVDLFQVNLHTPFILSQALMPLLIHSQGHIITLGVAGIKCPKAYLSTTAYCLTKSALWGLTLSLAREMASKKVRVNMVSPGHLDISVNLPSLNEIPMNRPGYCEEVCRVISFLLDEKNRYITGQNIEVAGGVGL